MIDSFSGGGIERLVIDQLKAASERSDLKITVVAAKLSGQLLPDVPPGVLLFEIGPYRGILNSIKLGFALKRICASQNAESIYSHSTTLNKSTLKAKVIFPSIPDVAVVEHTELKRQFSDKYSLYKRLTRPLEIRLLYRFAKRVIVVSSGIGKELVELCGVDESKISLIHNSVAQQRIGSSDRGNPPDRFQVISIGRLITEKRIDILLEAFAKLCRDTVENDPQLVILGDGGERNKLEALCDALEITDRVLFLGFMNDIQTELKKSSVLVSTSQYEGFGNVIVEAIGAGVPVIASPTAGAIDISRHVSSVTLLDSLNVNNVYEKLKDVASNRKGCVTASDLSFVASLAPDRVLQNYLAVMQ